MAAARRRLLWALLPPLFALCPAQTEPPGSLGLSLHPPYFNLAETAGIWATATCGEKEKEEEEEEAEAGGGGRPELYCKLVGGPAAAPLGRAIQVAWGTERGDGGDRRGVMGQRGAMVGTGRGGGAADPARSPGGSREGGRGSEDGDGGWRLQSCREEKQKSSPRLGGSVFCAWAETCQGREGAANAGSSVVCWGWWSALAGGAFLQPATSQNSVVCAFLGGRRRQAG